MASILVGSPSAGRLEGNAAFSGLIDSFLSAVKEIGDRTPSDDEIEVRPISQMTALSSENWQGNACNSSQPTRRSGS